MMTASGALSVVIPTLGGKSLAATIDRLNSGSVVPNEILVCIPRDEQDRAARLTAPNVRLVVTAFRGQVAQRAAGFAQAIHPYVMQLDDDMLVDMHCVARLLDVVAKEGPNVAVAPALLRNPGAESFYRTPENRTLLSLYYWLLNGSRGYAPGTITKAGTNIGVDPERQAQDTMEVEWVPGGCLMHRRENLILDNFYPYTGKAYCEDLFHSFHLRRTGVRLLVCASARCYLDNASVLDGTMDLTGFLRFLRADARARRYLLRLGARRTPRMYFYYLVMLMRFLFGRSKRLMGSTT